MCRLSGNLGDSTSWNHQGLSRPVMELLLFNFCLKYFQFNIQLTLQVYLKSKILNVSRIRLKHGDDTKVNKMTSISRRSECTIYLFSVSVINIRNKLTSECNRQSHKETKFISMLHLSLLFLSLSWQMTRSSERRLSLAGCHSLTFSLGINLTRLTFLLIQQSFDISIMTTLRAIRRIKFRSKSEDGFFFFQPAQTDSWTPSASCLKGSVLAFFPRKQLVWDVWPLTST
jgi:hypothetical protein